MSLGGQNCQFTCLGLACRVACFAWFSLLLFVGHSVNLSAASLTNSADVGIATTSGDCNDLYETSTATCSIGGASATAAVYTGTGGNVSVSSGSDSMTSANATLAYFVSVNGPSGTTVPVIVTGTSAMSSRGYSAYGLVETDSSGNGIAIELTAGFESTAAGCQQFLSGNPGGYCSLPGTFTIDTTLPSNAPIAVSLSTDISGANGSAMLDPIISIDPSFALASEFSVVPDAPGIFPGAPVSSTPEPMSGALLVVGLGGMTLGLQFRRSSLSSGA